jgi:Tfp pilus assembly protein PilF
VFKRQLAAAVIFAAGAGLVGCRSPMGGLAFWNSKQDSTIARAAPDVGEQTYDGLSKEFVSSGRPMGQIAKSSTALGGQAPPQPTGIAGMWHKSTAAIGGMFAARPNTESLPDATRLDAPAKKVGPEVYVAAARLMENQSKFPEAEAQYKKALEKSPNNESALVGLARLHDRQGESAKALALYEKAVKAHPKSALVHNDLGLCYARQKQLDRSLASLNKAVALQPDNVRYRNNLATVLVESGRTGEALEHLSKTGPLAVAHYNVGFLLYKRGQQGEAVQHLQQAIALDPNLTPAREMLAQWGAPAEMLQVEEPSPRIAMPPRFQNRIGSGTAAMPVSTGNSYGAEPEQGRYHVGDDGSSSPAGDDISDVPSLRLPPLE